LYQSILQPEHSQGCMSSRLLAWPGDGEQMCTRQKFYNSLTTSAAIVAYVYEGTAYNLVFLGQILPALGKEAFVTPLMVTFNISLGLALWSYYSARSSDPGKVPQRWQVFVSSVGELLPIVPPRLEWQAGKATYCHVCGVPRPERAHHCKVCGHCVLRMDHHCPWLSNCVGFKNHKFFILAVAYGLLTSCIAFFSALPELTACFAQLVGVRREDNLPNGGQLNMQSPYIWVFMLFGVIACVLIPLLGAMFSAHICLGFRNTTTIEGHFQSTVHPFDQGSSAENLAEIFGDVGIDWFLPIAPLHPRSDGVSFERTDIDDISGRSRCLSKDAPPERLWRARYRIRSEVPEFEAAPERDDTFMSSFLSWWQPAGSDAGSRDQDQESLIERGDTPPSRLGRRQADTKVVSL